MPSQANKAFITVCDKTYNKKINCQCYSIAFKEDQRLCHDILQYSQGAGSTKLYGQKQKSHSSTLHCSDVSCYCIIFMLKPMASPDN